MPGEKVHTRTQQHLEQHQTPLVSVQETLVERVAVVWNGGGGGGDGGGNGGCRKVVVVVWLVVVLWLSVVVMVVVVECWL